MRWLTNGKSDTKTHFSDDLPVFEGYPKGFNSPGYGQGELMRQGMVGYYLYEQQDADDKIRLAAWTPVTREARRLKRLQEPER